MGLFKKKKKFLRDDDFIEADKKEFSGKPRFFKKGKEIKLPKEKKTKKPDESK